MIASARSDLRKIGSRQVSSVSSLRLIDWFVLLTTGQT
jgi:hypothetical protein